MSTHWIIVADKSKARIFTVAESRGALLAVAELEHPEAREREQSLTSDRQGRSFDSAGKGRHAMGKTVEPGEHEAIRFAGQIADYVRAAQNEGRCNRLLLVAGPHFLGLLREQFSGLNGMEISVIDKNLGQYDAREIRKHLPERL
jgi:protein required for attachment to host cells